MVELSLPQSPEAKRRRRRAAATLGATAAAALTVVITAPDAVEAVTNISDKTCKTDTYTVKPGDGLESIAQDLEPTRDWRSVASEIQTLTPLEGAFIKAGQELTVPDCEEDLPTQN